MSASNVPVVNCFDRDLMISILHLNIVQKLATLKIKQQLIQTVRIRKPIVRKCWRGKRQEIWDDLSLLLGNFKVN
jgi:hypothetical protein